MGGRKRGEEEGEREREQLSHSEENQREREREGESHCFKVMYNIEPVGLASLEATNQGEFYLVGSVNGTFVFSEK